MYSLFLVCVTFTLLQTDSISSRIDSLIACSNSQIHTASMEWHGEGGSEIGWYSLQVFYSCNSLTKSSVSSDWNNFNVHFALDIFLTLTQA